MNLKLLSWNVAGRTGKMAQQAAAVSRQEADIVALQEVRKGTVGRWREALEADGLEHVVDSSEYLDDRRYFNLIASRWSCRPLPLSGAPYPERVLSVVAESPVGEIEVHNAHLPPGVTRGLIKVESFEAIFQMLARTSQRPRILCGDFNTPQHETRDGEVTTFADKHPRWLERWDAAERSVLTGLAEHDLRDVFRQLHGYDRGDVSWVFHTRRRRKAARRFDHVFASKSLNAVQCDYNHEWREDKLSDHSAIWAVFEPVAADSSVKCENCGRRDSPSGAWLELYHFERQLLYLCPDCQEAGIVISTAFAQASESWGMTLPPEKVAVREPGEVCAGKWHIRFVWGEEDGEEFLEYLATNRMTSDRWDRIHASGDLEQLSAPSEFMIVPDDPKERERTEREHRDSWRRYSEALERRGLLEPRSDA